MKSSTSNLPSNHFFNETDLQEMSERGVTRDQILSQIETFKRGISPIRLKRPCTAGDGIVKLTHTEVKRLGKMYEKAMTSGKATKFVPASGAATRMFRSLIAVHTALNAGQSKLDKIKKSDEYQDLIKFVRNLDKFAFFEELKEKLAIKGVKLDTEIENENYREILAALLEPEGLNYANLPKGLIKFHKYRNESRTAFEEHLVEAAEYARDEKGAARLHFTIPPEFDTHVKAFFQAVRQRYEKDGVRFEISFSHQKPSTDTIAVDLENTPIRDEDGKLHFRPGGHGALLENLNELDEEIVFIKNIDNVIPDRLKPETYRYKKALGGYLVEIQKELFGYLGKLSEGDVDENLLKQIFAFAKQTFSISPPPDVQSASRESQMEFLFSHLNRPIRVCGMVVNQGEPGGGPFWIEPKDDDMSPLQLVESAQVDQDSAKQQEIWESSTHFSPVDLVCGVRNFRGEPFDIMQYRDPYSGFISIKSKDGREIKALELPGLWNGSMAYWNSVFVEVPVITFNPVKTVFDLLRPEHQPA